MSMKETLLEMGASPVDPLFLKDGQKETFEKFLNDASLEKLKDFLSAGQDITPEQRQMIEDRVKVLGANIEPTKENVDVLKSMKEKDIDAAGNVLDKMQDENQNIKVDDVGEPAILNINNTNNTKTNTGKKIANEQRMDRKQSVKASKINEIKDNINKRMLGADR